VKILSALLKCVIYYKSINRFARTSLIIVPEIWVNSGGPRGTYVRWNHSSLSSEIRMKLTHICFTNNNTFFHAITRKSSA